MFKNVPKFKRISVATAVAGLVFATPVGATSPQTVKVIISGGFHQVYDAMIPEFEKSTGIKVETGSGASEGTGPQTIRYQLAHGAKADVVILSREGLEKIREDGRIREGSEAGLATAPLAASVRTSTAKLDISTNAAFRQALIDAGKIVAPGSTSGQFLRDTVFPKLALPKTVTLTLVARGDEAVAALKAGKFNLAICPTSELTNMPGLTLTGTLPGDYQIVQTFTAGIVSDAESPEAAVRLIDFLTKDSAQLRSAIKRAGMEPPANGK